MSLSNSATVHFHGPSHCQLCDTLSIYWVNVSVKRHTYLFLHRRNTQCVFLEYAITELSE